MLVCAHMTAEHASPPLLHCITMLHNECYTKCRRKQHAEPALETTGTHGRQAERPSARQRGDAGKARTRTDAEPDRRRTRGSEKRIDAGRRTAVCRAQENTFSMLISQYHSSQS